jgi:hypothetical protein
MDPYERWRQAVWTAGVVVIVVLTAAILLSCFGLLLGAVDAGQTGTPTGY